MAGHTDTLLRTDVDETTAPTVTTRAADTAAPRIGLAPGELFARLFSSTDDEDAEARADDPTPRS